jgi:protoheme IX farnesyltransferase
MTRFQKLAIAATSTTFALIGVGALVRATGSGEGCPNWPGCFPGRFLPPLQYHPLIEWSHRTLVGIDTILVGILLVAAIVSYRKTRAILVPSILAFALIVAEAILGGIVVKGDLHAALVTAHFATAMCLAGVLVALTTITFLLRAPIPREAPDRSFARLAVITSAATFALLLVGAYVRGRGAGLAFPDWPLMDGKLVPQLGGIASVMFVHRVLAALVGLLVVYVGIRAWATRRDDRAIVVLSTVTVALFLVQIAVGGVLVRTGLATAPRVAHVLLAALVWGSLVALSTVAMWRRRGIGAGEAASDAEAAGESHPSLRERTVAYFQLTKPRIILLLLITTIPAMVLAGGRFPSVLLVTSTLFGGALAAGGANAFNCYLDRDIDQIMRRTRRRPLPSHRVAPENALTFGYVLGALSFFWLATTVNVLAAALALSALAFYVFVYTLWLKRSTAQNIVIGGAAGAVPVLVGWAAVTGTVALPAFLLFTIVFVWTPPHFWALSMRYANDYASAGVPMLPVVKGIRATAWNILVYSVVLVAVTIVLWPVGGMGALYVVAAVGLGAVFLRRAVQLWRDTKPAVAMRLFRYSIVYLALLFAAVAVDRLIPIGL